MMLNPRIGQRVQLWYARSYCAHMPLHAKIGVVAICNRVGKPRNHGVVVDGVLHSIPCGNLRKVE